MPHRITLHDLRMLMGKSDEELLRNLNRPSFGFETFLKTRRYSCLSEDALEVLAYVVHVISNACSTKSRGITGSVRRLLRMILECEKFLFEDVLEAMHSCFAKKQGIVLVRFLADYMIILHVMLRFNIVCDKITDTAFPHLQNFMNRVKEMKMRNVNVAADEFNKLKLQIERLERQSDPQYEEADILGSFRHLSVVPRSNDIVNCEITKLPCNIIEGPYENVNHYLSVHYCLMREDMLRCFRNCIKTCISSDSAARSKNRIYDSVQVGHPPIYTPQGIVYNVRVISNTEIDWTNRDILTPGSLVCLTHDRFRTVVFATVCSDSSRSETGKSRECRVKLKLEDDSFTDELSSQHSYEMIEPEAYFECYRHVLSAIKEFSEANFPLSDIITFLDCDNTEPEYMKDCKKYCLQVKSEGESEANTEETQSDSNIEETHPCKPFNPLKYEEWPTAEELGLDEQQYEAFRLALTKNVAVIQGPPGTGKTYIGAKVVKAMLDNGPKKPIIVSCLTNHALDQFLERILNYTKKVVRLGSQSKSNVIEPYTMDNMLMSRRKYIEIGQNNCEKMDVILQKSLDVLVMLGMDLLQEYKGEYDEQAIALKNECIMLKKKLNSLSLCEEKFLDEDALNFIIDSECKKQLRREHESANLNIVSGVLEWFACSHASELYKQCEKHFTRIKRMTRSNQKLNISFRDLWTLKESERYQLFYFWKEKCLSVLRKDIDYRLEEYKKIMRKGVKKNIPGEKAVILQRADIIGVTTTGASKFRDLLNSTDARIVVIEEAAQVLESHIIASLPKSTQHLIMIGDHKQLRPLPADDELAKKYRLNISMFERLFENNAPSATLVTQHRMRPSISELLVPEIYERLENFSNVFEYDDIWNVRSNVFFLDHSEPEDSNSSSVSSSNKYEALMIVSLTKYFLAQSYLASQITILTTYAAQVSLIHEYLKEENLEVKATTVDNYQGEENDIILISYVRSNPFTIGYLKESTRVCVSLSRARLGLFCLGNFKLYASKSELWKSLVDKLHAKNMIGEFFPMECAWHKKCCFGKTSNDVLRFIREGCSENCDYVLPCGHVCTRKCHFDDREHSRYLCTMPCGKYIDETRICPRLCYQRCKKPKKQTIVLPCGHSSRAVNVNSMFNAAKCEVEVQKYLPCNHFVTVPCHVDPKAYLCKHLMPVVLPCGHRKNVPCCDKNNIKNIVCNELRDERGACGHIIDVPCDLNWDGSEILSFCTKSCDKLLSCGHPCAGSCRWCFDIGIHTYCTSNCEKKLECGHPCEGYCNSPCAPCKKRCFLTCDHNTRCISSCLRPCVECKNPCARRCPHVECTKLCFEECNVEPCFEACREKLPCGHTCIGLCNDPCPHLCRFCNREDLKCKNPEKDRFVILTDCDHIIEVNELTEHIDNCLECFDWPYCPVCFANVTKSVRYKTHLQKAKRFVIGMEDVSDEISEINYHFNSMYGDNLIIPAVFHDVHNRIKTILNREHLTRSSVIVLRTCVLCLGKLVTLSKRYPLNNAESYDEGFVNRFHTLLIWISNHLTSASYQQLQELTRAVGELFKWHLPLLVDNTSDDENY